jgi:hypothetical protein
MKLTIGQRDALLVLRTICKVNHLIAINTNSG